MIAHKLFLSYFRVFELSWQLKLATQTVHLQKYSNCDDIQFVFLNTNIYCVYLRNVYVLDATYINMNSYEKEWDRIGSAHLKLIDITEENIIIIKTLFSSQYEASQGSAPVILGFRPSFSLQIAISQRHE